MRTVHGATVGERVYWDELESGFRTYVMPRPLQGRCSTLLTVDFGSLDRTLWWHDASPPALLPAGVAHFLEHRLFEKRLGDISERFGLCGADVDADTSFTHTGFSFSSRNAFPESLELLFELAFTLCVDDSNVEREREIIEHEIQLSADALEWISYFRALDTVYPGQPLSEDIAGTRESLESIDSHLLLLCHDTLYNAANTALYVCGEVDPQDVFALAARYLSRYAHAVRSPRGFVRRETVTPGAALHRTSRLPIVRPHVTLAFAERRTGLVGMDLLQREVALELTLYALLGPGSRFYSQGYEAGVIDSGTFGFEVNTEPTFGVCLISAETSAPEALEDSVLETLTQARRHGLDATDFHLARRRAYGDIVRAYGSAESCVELMHDEVKCGAQPFDLLSAHGRVTLADAEDCLRSCLRPEHCGVSLIDPIAERAGR